MSEADWFEGGRYTPLPDVFIDKHMTKCPKPEYAFVYILGCRYESAGLNPPVLETAEKLGMTTDEVLRAWAHFEEAGLAKLVGEGLDARIDLIRGGEKDKPAVPVVKAAARIRPEKPPVYKPETMERMQFEDAEIKFVFATAEKLLGKPLTYRELNALLTFYDWYDLSADVIGIMLEHCITNGHKSFRYIEAVAQNWSDNNITTIEEAEAYITMFNKDFREIMRAFGNSRRDPATAEQDMMRKWLKQYMMPLDMIKAACGKTVMQTGQPKWQYADAILTKWNEAGVRTVDDLNRIQDAFYETISVDGLPASNRKGLSPEGAALGGKKPRAKAKNRFSNYEAREWDYDKLLELEQIHIDKALSEKNG